MSDHARELNGRSPSREEVDQILRDAHAMRAEVTRNAVASLWTMLRRSVSRRNVARAPRHV